MLFVTSILIAQSAGGVGSIDSTSILIAAITLVGTLAASWFMLRGKTQDTANWLIKELRGEAESARKTAQDCDAKRIEDRVLMDDLRSLVAALQAGLRRITRENEQLKTEMSELRSELELQYGRGRTDGTER